MTPNATPPDASAAPAFEPTRIQVQTAPSHDALPPGTRLGEYEIERVLGEGGFGIVYLATDHGLERHVAIKEYLPAALASRGKGTVVTLRSEAHAETFALGLRSFVNEARLLARFDHPSLVRVYRFWEANHTAYMVMPFYEGRTLAATREALTAPPDEAWLRRLLTDLGGALAELHAASCYHRDIAPDNILMLADGRPVLLDFGAARRVIGDRTQTLTAILKPAYAPIEQYAEVGHLQQGPWTDLYALAAVVYYCISGRSPTPSTVRAVDDQLRPLSHLVAQLREQHPDLHYSDAFVRAIEWALAVRPSERPQTVTEFLAALEGPPPAPSAWRAAAPSGLAGGAEPATSRRASASPLRAVPGGAAGAEPPLTREAVAATPPGGSPGPSARVSTPGTAGGAAPEARGAAAAERASATAAPAVWHFGAATTAAAPAAPEDEAVLAAIQAALRDIPADGGGAAPRPAQEAAAATAGAPARTRRARWAAAAAALLVAGAAAWTWRDHVRTEEVLRSLARPAGAPVSAEAPAPLAQAPRSEPLPPAAAPAAAPPTAEAASTAAAAPPAPLSSPPPASAAAGAGLAPGESTVETHAASAGPSPGANAAIVPSAPARPGRGAAGSPRDSVHGSPRGSTRETPPEPPRERVADAPRPPASPREACGNRTQFSLYYCMQKQCERGAFYNHPQCQRLRATDEVG